MITEALTRRPVVITAAVVAVLSVVGVSLGLVHRERPSSWSLRVHVATGELRGIAADGVASWRGIPYAAPPTGERRWHAPEKAAAWRGVRDASGYGASCVQPKPFVFGAPTVTQAPGTSEDCLFLNVNRPDDASRNLPVLVWLHGGGFFEGSGSIGFPNTPGLTRRGVVVVTANYRLGRLGFFAHPGLGGRVANFGLLDQMAALRWVRANISAFGGDPDRITLAGTSAGGMSVNALMASPRAQGLFDRAIVESGPGDEHPRTLAGARADGGDRFPGLTANELRDLPASRFLDSSFNVFAGDAPILDAVLPRRPTAVFAAGEEARVPYLVGNTDGEFTEKDWRSLGIRADAVRDRLGRAAQRRLVRAYGTRGALTRHLLDDAVFSLPAARLARDHARRAPTFRYRFAALGHPAPHSAEVPYVFDYAGPDVDPVIAHRVSAYWAAFIATGRPDVPGAPPWPDARAGALLIFWPNGPKAYAADPQWGRLAALARVMEERRAR